MKTLYVYLKDNTIADTVITIYDFTGCYEGFIVKMGDNQYMNTKTKGFYCLSYGDFILLKDGEVVKTLKHTASSDIVTLMKYYSTRVKRYEELYTGKQYLCLHADDILGDSMVRIKSIDFSIVKITLNSGAPGFAVNYSLSGDEIMRVLTKHGVLLVGDDIKVINTVQEFDGLYDLKTRIYSWKKSKDLLTPDVLEEYTKNSGRKLVGVVNQGNYFVYYFSK